MQLLPDSLPCDETSTAVDPAPGHMTSSQLRAGHLNKTQVIFLTVSHLQTDRTVSTNGGGVHFLGVLIKRYFILWGLW